MLAYNSCCLPSCCILGPQFQVVSPWGKVVAKADEKESITYADVDLEFLAQVRTQVPIGTQRREDIYLLSRVKSTS